MKKETQKNIFKAVNLLLIFLLIANTVTAQKVKTEDNKQNYKILDQKDQNIKNIVIGKGDLYSISPLNFDNFNGKIEREDFDNGGYYESARGWIKNTDIIVDKSYSNSIMYLIIFPQLLQTESFRIKNFSGYVSYSYYTMPHMIAQTSIKLIGTSDNIEKI